MSVFRTRLAVLAVVAGLAFPVAAQLAPCCEPCYESCHMDAMWWYYKNGYDVAASFFDFCIATRC